MGSTRNGKPHQCEHRTKRHQHTQPRSRDPEGTADLQDSHLWQREPAQVLLVSALIWCMFASRCHHPRRRNSTPPIPVQAHSDHVLLEHNQLQRMPTGNTNCNPVRGNLGDPGCFTKDAHAPHQLPFVFRQLMGRVRTVYSRLCDRGHHERARCAEVDDLLCVRRAARWRKGRARGAAGAGGGAHLAVSNILSGGSLPMR